jgi:hypothetical protein
MRACGFFEVNFQALSRRFCRTTAISAGSACAVILEVDMYST